MFAAAKKIIVEKRYAPLAMGMTQATGMKWNVKVTATNGGETIGLLQSARIADDAIRAEIALHLNEVLERYHCEHGPLVTMEQDGTLSIPASAIERYGTKGLFWDDLRIHTKTGIERLLSGGKFSPLADLSAWVKG